MVLVTSMIQCGIQALMRPAVWIPGVRNTHQYRESWQTSVRADECMELTLKALDTLIKSDSKTTFYDVHKVDKVEKFIRIFVLTRAEWLDVVEIYFYNNGADVYSFSSGLVPISVPLSFILNAVLCFVPFSDRGFNRNRVEKLRQAMGVDVQTRTVPGND